MLGLVNVPSCLPVGGSICGSIGGGISYPISPCVCILLYYLLFLLFLSVPLPLLFLFLLAAVGPCSSGFPLLLAPEVPIFDFLAFLNLLVQWQAHHLLLLHLLS